MFKPKPKSQIKRLIERDGTRCHYCGVELSFEWSKDDENYRTIDHVKPQAKGGKSLLDNLVLACQRCNWDKHTMSYQEFRMKRETDSILLWFMDGESCSN